MTRGAASVDVELPPPDEAAEVLRRLTVPPDHIDRIVAAAPDRHRHPLSWAWLEHCVGTLVDDLGGFDPLAPWPPAPVSDGSERRQFLPVWVFVATLPHTQRWHARRGIPDDVAWATFANLGDAIDRYARAHGEPSLDVVWWLTLHFRGSLYRLGRLQLNLIRLRSEPGRLGLGVHIPAGSPLDPAACDDSFRWAAHFFAEHFPEHPRDVAECTSWLLDPQLADHLPPESNIVRFQRRFELVGEGWDAESDVMRFVFGRPRPLDELPRRTTLERALVDHLRAGGQWRVRTGWLAADHTRG